MKLSLTRAVAGIAFIPGLVILFVLVFFIILNITEYRPAKIETLESQNHSASRPERLSPGVPFGLLTWNIGYGSLDESQDFFMDGGKNVRPKTDENVRRNLSGIRETITMADCDVILIQEADIASHRSYKKNQPNYLAEFFNGISVFAHNFRCIFVPIPFPEFIGKVSSGLLTLSRFETSENIRISLPNPFSWPLRIANLKRCLLVSRIPLNGSGAELVVVNLHLEAYESSGGRDAQTRALLDFLYKEYAKGNYCIAGGDFNQNFPGIDPVRFALKKTDHFVPGTLSPSLLADGWQYATGLQAPTCRLLDEPYLDKPQDTQFYVIDGFIVSPNVEILNVKTFDLEFKHSDHNPVKIEAILKL